MSGLNGGLNGPNPQDFIIFAVCFISIIVFTISMHIVESESALSRSNSSTHDADVNVRVGDITRSQIAMTLVEFKSANHRLISTAHSKDYCKCGCVDSPIDSCPRRYDLKDVDKSARTVMSKDLRDYTELYHIQHKRHAEVSCYQMGNGVALTIQDQVNQNIHCLQSLILTKENSGAELESIVIPYPDREILLPGSHIKAFGSFVNMILDFVDKEDIRSLNDFGAGVGQYGGPLVKRFPDNFLYRGYDFAGDVESYTQGFIKYFNLAIPLNLPVADFVMCLEVGEHISNDDEGMVIRNLHRHNCKGIILSWGTPRQPGMKHINLHPNDYFIDIFTELGYVFDEVDTNHLKDSIPFGHKMKDNIMIFRRSIPIC